MKQNSELVVRQFEDQIKDYTDEALVEYSAIPGFLQKALRNMKSGKTLHIVEFGGGGGNLLAYIQKKVKRKLRLTNIEIVKKYKGYQVSPSVSFIHGSVLAPPIQKESCDVVIVRNVLHHLITDSLAKTRNNQMDAIRELMQVVRPGGYVLIEEQVNNNLLSCLIFYYASTLATKIGLRIDILQITPNTIVGYMTRGKLQWMCERHAERKQWVVDAYERWNLPWYWQMTGLMTDTGEAFIAIQKPTV